MNEEMSEVTVVNSDEGVVTAKRGKYTLRYILPKHRYIQKVL
jgi:hypothetical protein